MGTTLTDKAQEYLISQENLEAVYIAPDAQVIQWMVGFTAPYEQEVRELADKLRALVIAVEVEQGDDPERYVPMQTEIAVGEAKEVLASAGALCRDFF